jgi:DNA (cytosine-5)-methyltransferase 1
VININNFIEIHKDHIRVREATKQGYAIGVDGDSINFEQPNSKTRRGRIGHQIAQTLTCSCNQGVIIDMNELIQVGMIDGKGFESRRRVYSDQGLSPTLHGIGSGGGTEPKIQITNKLSNERGNTMKEFTNNLIKYNFKMDDIELFDSFAGVGALHQNLTELGIPTKNVGLSETDVDAIISYAGVHIKGFKDIEFEYPSENDMRNLLMDRNIGWDFMKQKSCIPRLKKDKLYKVYKATVLLNNLGDISKLDYKNLPDFDLFNMSFPCTDISGAGQQKGLKNADGTHTRSGLVKYGIEVIRAKKPKYIMIENVKALIQKKFIDDFNDIVNEIESYGYKCYYPKKDNGQATCLNAKDYGIAQNRERIFVICVRNDIDDGLFSFPQGFDSGLRLKDFLEDEVDEKYYLDKPWHMSTESDEKHDTNEIAQIEGINYKATRSITDPNLYCRTLDTMGGGQREPKVLDMGCFVDKKDRIQEFKETKNYIQWDTSGKGYTSQVDRAFYENGVVGTIPAMNPQDKTQVIENMNSNNFRIRKLTPKECWRLMGFRDECFDRAKELGISDSALYKQAGNSIVVNCLYYIFKELFKKYIVE